MSSPSRPVVLAVDCSTTASKAVAVDPEGRTVAEARRDLTVESPRAGRHEQDPEQWWTATRDALAEAVAALPAGTDVRALCLTHQRESFACFDDGDAALRPAMLWVDGRAGEQIARLGSERVQELSGKPPDVTPALYKLAWLTEHEPDVLAKARRVADVAAYLHRRLTGRWASSTVSADALGLFDLRHRTWAPELLEMAGVREEQLPELVAPGAEVGTLTDGAAEALGLPADIPVIAGLGDGQAAGLGAAATERGVAYLNLGTAMVLGVQATEYVWDPAIRTLAGVAAGTFTPETLLSSGTYLTTWFRTRFGDPAREGKPDPELDAAAEAAGPGADGLLTLPYWNAAQAPYWDPQARGATVGWHGGHTRGHAYRSLLEACAYEARLHLDGLERATGDRVTVVRAVGGGVRSTLWRQIVADVAGRPLEVCADDEISARGAAVLGFAATDDPGVLHDTAQRMAPPTRTVEPDPAAHDRYAPLYDVYRELYPALRDVFPKLARATGEGVTVRAAVFHEPGDLRIEDLDEQEPGPGEILVDVGVAVTCGTDLKSYRRGHPKLFPELPARFGHEFAGVVSAVGDGVERFRPGQRVVAANSAPCFSCWACTIGRLGLCENLRFLNGAFAEQVVVPAPIVAHNTFVLPDALDLAAAAPLEPLACVVHGIAESGIALGDTVVVHGAGPIGLMFVRLAVLRGATVIAVDVRGARLRSAADAGAAETLDLGRIDDQADREAAIRRLTPGERGADVGLEAAGRPEAWEQTVRTLRPGGTAVLFGGPPSGTTFAVDTAAMHYGEHTLKGVFHHTPQYVRTAVDLLVSGQVDGASLITETRPLDALVESLEDMAEGRGSKYALVP